MGSIECLAGVESTVINMYSNAYGGDAAVRGKAGARRMVGAPLKREVIFQLEPQIRALQKVHDVRRQEALDPLKVTVDFVVNIFCTGKGFADETQVEIRRSAA